MDCYKERVKTMLDRSIGIKMDYVDVFIILDLKQNVETAENNAQLHLVSIFTTTFITPLYSLDISHQLQCLFHFSFYGIYSFYF
jgi:hypothetical protein